MKAVLYTIHLKLLTPSRTQHTKMSEHHFTNLGAHCNRMYLKAPFMKSGMGVFVFQHV